ncbi:MAG TPA: DUF4129 domain-containing protein [Sulfolobales archaeon]|nr:DUF4129 domain-containing protein [Sulfolobales archaeon]
MRGYGGALLLVLVVLLASISINSEAQNPGYNTTVSSSQDLGDLSVYLGMHTINFSQVLSLGVNGYSGSEDLNKSLSNIIEALRNITMGCDTLSCIAQNRSARASIEHSVRELERSGYIDPSTASEILDSMDQVYLGDEALKRLISDPEVGQLINSILSSGVRDYQGALGILDSLFRGGRISLNEYVAALELLKRLSLRQGQWDQALAIDRMQLEAIKQLILSNTAEGLVKSLTGILASSETSGSAQQGGWEGSRTTYLGAMPSSIYIPVSASIPGFDFLTLVLIIIGISAVMVVIILGVQGIIPSIVRGPKLKREPSPREIGLRGGVIGVYWKAVGLLSRKIPKRPSETHREYLEKVRERLNNTGSFEDLTKIYEMVRYGHESEEAYIDKAIKDYEELERS